MEEYTENVGSTMKVYILFYGSKTLNEILGVFLTLEEANNCKMRFMRNFHGSIKETDVIIEIFRNKLKNEQTI